MAEEFLGVVIKAGLVFAACVQIMCVAALFTTPTQTLGQGKDFDGTDDETSDQSSPLATPRKPQTYHRNRKTDKKKRR